MIIENYLYVRAIYTLLDGLELNDEEKALYTYLTVQDWRKGKE